MDQFRDHQRRRPARPTGRAADRPRTAAPDGGRGVAAASGMSSKARRASGADASGSSPRVGVRRLAYGLVAVVVIGTGVVLAAADLIGRRDEASAPEAIPVRLSMAGFDPAIIMARPGERLAIELWTTDSALHLEGGVHTFISDELGIHEELPAESRRIITLTAPERPGDYDVYCDTCCGGRPNPAMHAVLRVEA